MKKILFISWMLCMALVVRAEENVKVGSLWYSVNNDKTYATVIKAQEGDSYTGSIVIPATIAVQVSEDSEETIDVPVTAIGTLAFQKTKITEITIPASVVSIGSRAFESCTTLEKATYASIGQICGMTFTGRDSNPLYNASQKHLYISGSATEVTNLVIPNGTTTIKAYAFVNCNNLTSVTIPSSVREIKTDAFYSTSSQLTKATFASAADLCSIDFGNLQANPLYYAHNLYFGTAKQTEISIPASSLYNHPEYGKSIRPYILAGATCLTKVTIPSDAVRILNSAFEGCTNLQYAVYPTWHKVISMGYNNKTANPLYYAKQLIADGKLVSIIEIYEDIQDNAFNNAKWLETAIIKEGVTSIGASAFEGCSNLTLVVLPSTLKTIGAKAFWSCETLAAPTLPSGLQSIGDGVFHNCKSGNFKSITIPDNCYLGEEVFYQCSQLTTVTLPASLDTIRKNSFNRCYNLTDLTLPATVKAIGENAFRDCNKLTVFPTGGSVETIFKYAFSGCTGITSLVLPETVKDIKVGAFDGCANLKTVTIPASVEAIGDKAFGGTLDEVFCLRAEAPPTHPTAFNDIMGATLYVVDATAKTKYEAEDPWKSFGSITCQNQESTLTFFINDKKLEGKVITLGGGAVIDTTLIPKAPFPEGEIFSGWDKEIPLTMPNEPMEFYGYVSTKQTIGDFRYHLMPAEVKNGKSLPARATLLSLDKEELTVNDTQVTIPAEVTFGEVNYPVTAIGPNAFKGQTNMRILTLPSTKSIKTVGSAAFMGCTSLTKIENFDGVTEVSDSLFYKCSILTTVTLSDNVTKIGRLSFGSCSLLDLTKLPASLTTIGTQAFANTGIKAVTLAGTITSMGEEVFKECRQLETATFDNSFSLPLPKLTFWNCSSLQNVSLSTSMVSILESAFQGCSMLSSFIIPEGVTSIAATAFKGCSQLTSISLPASMSGVGSKAFEGCTKLRQVIVERDEAPFCANDAFPQTVYDESYLFVDHVAEYKSKDPWKKFKNISTQDNYTLTYQVDGTQYGEPYSVMVGTAIEPKTEPTKAGHEFSGWLNLPEVMPGKDTTVVGNFQYELKFYENSVADANRLLKDEKYAFYYGDKVVLPVDMLKRDKFKFNLKGLKGEDVVYEDNAADLNMTMPANDINVIVEYSTAEVVDTIYGITYKIMLLENRAEVVSGPASATSLTIPANVPYNNKSYPVKTICPDAFRGTKNLKSITISNSVDSIGKQAFRSTELQDVTIPSSVTKMGEEVFLYCTNLETVSVSANITTLPAGIFSDCTSLKTVTLPNTLQVIGERAFNGCSAIENLTLPESVVSLGERAFWNVFGEEDYLIISGTTLPTAADNTFDNTAYLQATIKTSATNFTAPWDQFVHVESASGGNGPCADPVIKFEVNKLVLSCATPNSTIYYKVTVDDNHEYSKADKNTGIVTLTKQFTVEAYATADDYTRSKTATETFYFEVGDVNHDGKVSITDAVGVVNIILTNQPQ